MKIGLVSPFPPPNGGMTVLAGNIRDALVAENVSVIEINTNSVVPKIFQLMRIGLLFQHLRFYLGLFKIRNLDSLFLISSSGLSFYSKMIPSLIMARVYGKDAILNYVGGGILGKLNQFNSFFIRLFDVVLVPTNVFKDAFNDHKIPCSVLPNIVRIESFAPKDKQNAVPVIVSAKALEEYSSIDDIIKAFFLVKRNFPDSILKIAGSGPERKNLEVLVDKLSLTGVEFLGNVPSGEMPKLLQSATILVHATRVESFGLILVEAMASGTPIVSTDVGGIPEVVDNGADGLLVSHGDYVALAECVCRLLGDVDLYDSMRFNGISKSQMFGRMAVAKKLMKIVSLANLE